MRNIQIRFDKNAILFFSREDGTKLRLSIGPYTKASKPELVDIKITDFCDVGCAFCYQDSTLLGRHATEDSIDYVVNELSKVSVNEVALGGGETTSHPDFVNILRKFSEAKIVPNFTTKKPAAVRKLWDSIHSYVGGFAYSAETSGQIYSAAKLLRNIPKEKVSLHYVMGLGDQDHFEDYMKAANDVDYRVTLLGYKTSGRGKEMVPYPYDWWIESINKLISNNECPNFSIDTPLAAEYEDEIPVDPVMFHTTEGSFSMYIDAVSLEFGPSSFTMKENLLPFRKGWRKIYSSNDFVE